jgi:RNA polymerase sigma-70 factor, ECF subfamily
MNRDEAELRFRRLYLEHYGALLAYALRRLPDAAEAHDAVADTFLVLWRRLEVAPGDDGIAPWLYGVIRRVLANQHRASKRRARLAERFAGIAAEFSETEESSERRFHARMVLQALQELNERDREILLLAAWERLSTAEIAEMYDCSENAAALRLHRARKRLTALVRKKTGQPDKSK